MTNSIALIVLWTATILAGCSSFEADGNASAVQDKVAFETQVKATVRSGLRDPNSAEFSEIMSYPEAGVACGKVNAKNAFGGYAGAESFAYAHGQAAVASGDAQAWARYSTACGAAMNADSIKRLEHTKALLPETGLSPDEQRRQATALDEEMAALKNGS